MQSVFYADNEDSDQTARMRSLIWVFVGRTCQKLHFLTFWLIISYVGLAYVGTMCKTSSGKSASIVQDVGDFQSASVIAHELGHR